MGYMHIENLYRPSAQSILLFKQRVTCVLVQEPTL